MTRILRVLFLTETFTFPPVGGGQIRDRYLIELLREQCDVEVLTFQSKLNQALPSRVTVNTVPACHRTFFEKIPSLFRPYFVNGYNQEMEKMIRRKAGPQTLLWASRLTMAKYLHLGPELDLKTLLDEHNVESRVLMHCALQRTSSWLSLPKALRSRTWEASLCDSADITVVTSQEDATRLHRLTHKAKIRVVPNCIDISLYRSALPSNPSIDFLFLGSLDYGPNVEGLLWFVRRVLPKLRVLLGSNRPRITVAGSNPSVSLVQTLQTSGIELVINPPRTQDLLAKASIVFVPLLFGSGTRVKIIEAMAAGCPVISTPIGAEGLGLTDRTGIWIASAEHEFATGMSLLLQKPSLRKQIASEALQIAEAHYDWRVMRPFIQGILEELAS